MSLFRSYESTALLLALIVAQGVVIGIILLWHTVLVDIRKPMSRGSLSAKCSTS